MLTIALTGGIGSGKSAVTDLFQKLASQSNFSDKLIIIDADIIAKCLLAGSLKNSSCSTALREVKNLFGPTLFNADGCLNRNKLRSLIFSSDEKKHQLESLLHPLVYEEISTQLSAIHSGIVIVAIPLFFETRKNGKSQENFDRILVIDIPIELQIERSTKRDNCSPELISKIINAQVERKVRLAQADDIIDNSGTVSELQLKVESLFQKYCSLEKQL